MGQESSVKITSGRPFTMPVIYPRVYHVEKLTYDNSLTCF